MRISPTNAFSESMSPAKPMVGDKLGRAVRLFNRRDFLAAGEVFEDVWRDASEADRPLYDAILRIAAALHLGVNRGGRRGAVNLLQQALVRLDDLRPARSGIDTETLYTEAGDYLQRLQGTSASIAWLERLRLPRIRNAVSPAQD
jgi:predicted metal-dependent hydrolase